MSFPAPAGKCEETRGADRLEFQLHGAGLDMGATSNLTLILQSPSETFFNKRLKCKSQLLPAREEFSTTASETLGTLLLTLCEEWTLINAELQRNSSSITYFTPAAAAMSSL